MAGSTDLGAVRFDITEELTAKLQFPKPVPPAAKSVTFTVDTTAGVGPTGPVSLDMPPRS
jgi:hypothetical protein